MEREGRKRKELGKTGSQVFVDGVGVGVSVIDLNLSLHAHVLIDSLINKGLDIVKDGVNLCLVTLDFKGRALAGGGGGRVELKAGNGDPGRPVSGLEK